MFYIKRELELVRYLWNSIRYIPNNYWQIIIIFMSYKVGKYLHSNYFVV